MRHDRTLTGFLVRPTGYLLAGDDCVWLIPGRISVNGTGTLFNAITWVSVQYRYGWIHEGEAHRLLRIIWVIVPLPNLCVSASLPFVQPSLYRWRINIFLIPISALAVLPPMLVGFIPV